MFSIDYLVGRDDYLGAGYGKAIAKALIEAVKRQPPGAQIVVQPEPENTLSVRALIANGFVYDGDGKYFVLR